MTHTVNRTGYIFAQQRRERAAVNRLIADEIGGLAGAIGPQLRWCMPWTWLGRCISHKRVLRGHDVPPNSFTGDVDVFGACLEPASQEEFAAFLAVG